MRLAILTPFQETIHHQFSCTQTQKKHFVIQCNLQTAAELTMGISPAATYNFVAIIDGQYYVITHTRNIPPDLHKGFDISIYTNTSDNEVMPDELL